MDTRDKKIRIIGEKLLPADFPLSALVTPKAVQFKASDGQIVYGQLFEPRTGGTKKPAVLFIHGGPSRQMLLGWHYGDYYSNTYALNQYLANLGFIVLSVNYRLGIGYGYEFQHPVKGGYFGASEYLDVKAAGEWLAGRPQVDRNRIGVYGGSYGGFLTALALGRDSKLFAAGVDIHGVHNHLNFSPALDGEQPPDAELARKMLWKSSPVSWVDGMSSPVLFIHGDDDGNVGFDESLDLIRRFQQKGKPFESLVIPDETHHWMRHMNSVKVDEAVAEFLKRKLMKP
jgi:dipeptidyl aminopeptidase/acylaminoacyl peptidase